MTQFITPRARRAGETDDTARIQEALDEAARLGTGVEVDEPMELGPHTSVNGRGVITRYVAKSVNHPAEGPGVFDATAEGFWPEEDQSR